MILLINNNAIDTQDISAMNQIGETSILTTEAQTELTTCPPIETTVEETTTSAPSYPNMKYPDLVVEREPFKEDISDDKVVYLTFDDGPCDNTSKLIDLLKQYNVKATFFVTAQYLEDDELKHSLKELHDNGHEVAVHTYSHNYHQIYSSVDNFLEDYKKMDDLIVQSTGERSHVFRFPGGSNAKYINDIRDDLLKEMTMRGFVYHDWNSYDGGCDNYSINGMISKAVGEATAHNKSVLLMHDTPDKDFIFDTLPDIISQIQAQGYRFDTLDGTVKPYQFIETPLIEDENSSTSIE